MKKLNFIFIVPFILFNCTNKFKSLENELLIIDNNILTRDLIVIPKEGCAGCILNATHYVENNIDRIKENILFTDIQDIKLFKLKVDSGFLNNEKVFLDTQNKVKSKEIGIYPVLIETKDGEIISVSDYSAPVKSK
jgi:hypothetical protein